MRHCVWLEETGTVCQVPALHMQMQTGPDVNGCGGAAVVRDSRITPEEMDHLAVDAYLSAP